MSRETLEVYTVVERGKGDDAKSYWVRVGSAWVNKDRSVNVRLDALPVNGTLQIRKKSEPETDE